jgi:hypothetical protein
MNNDETRILCDMLGQKNDLKSFLQYKMEGLLVNKNQQFVIAEVNPIRGVMFFINKGQRILDAKIITEFLPIEVENYIVNGFYHDNNSPNPELLSIKVNIKVLTEKSVRVATCILCDYGSPITVSKRNSITLKVNNIFDYLKD